MKKESHVFAWILLMMVITVTAVIGNGSKAEAASTYYIKINKQQNCVTVYKMGDNGKYEPYKAMACSAGWATPLGRFSVRDKIRWHELDGPVYGQYCSRITTHILFHSVWYYVNGNPATLSNYQYNKLGSTASHGCVRLCVADSKWIYDNCPMGTPIEIYNSSNPGPLGKPEAIKLPDGRGWDPTDVTNPNNPYNKKKPVIKLKKGNPKRVDLPYASEFDVKGAVTAKNTTGFDCTAKVKYKIEYKLKGEPTYKKVKKINTRKVGNYKVTYSVTDEIGRKATLKVIYKVNTKVKMTSFTINKKEKTLYLGGSESDATLKLKLKSCKPSKASIKALEYFSENSNIATVDSEGKVKAVAPGTTRICALAKDGSGLKEYCNITVKKYASSVSATVSNANLKIGETVKITTALVPSNATGNNVKYSYASSNANIAVVDTSGRITAVAQGTAEITVSVKGAAKNKTLTSKITINVTENVLPAPSVSPVPTVAPTAPPGDVSTSAVVIQ